MLVVLLGYILVPEQLPEIEFVRYCATYPAFYLMISYICRLVLVLNKCILLPTCFIFNLQRQAVQEPAGLMITAGARCCAWQPWLRLCI